MPRALTLSGSQVSYREIEGSPEFAAYRALARRLRNVDPAELHGDAERTAFWINVYNALVIDAVISFGVRESIREAPGFFHRAAYQVGPYRLDLDEIEHGLLRGNRPRFSRLPAPFATGDPRLDLGPRTIDPRAHFALNCDTRSCPPVAFYDADRLDEQLEAAASSFINSDGVRLQNGGVVLSPLFEFYLDDFGGRAGVIDWVLRYLDDDDLRARLSGGTLQTGTYDWTLNRW
ncbi:MAG: DUF547 domain-containing protein [Chloroflexi bacterium]|nr:DUF547 domain-containing protein [Chloroflexota bacterium]